MVNRWDNPDSLLARCLIGSASNEDRARLAELAKADPDLRAQIEEWQVCQFLQGGMSPAEQDAFAERLAAEPSLADLLAGYGELDDCLSKLADEELDLPETMLADQRQAIVSSVTRRRRLRAWLIRPAIGALATAAMLLAVAGIWLGLAGEDRPWAEPSESVARAEVVALAERAPEAHASAELPRLYVPRDIAAAELGESRGGSVVVTAGGREPFEPTDSLLFVEWARPVQWIRRGVLALAETWNQLAGA